MTIPLRIFSRMYLRRITRMHLKKPELSIFIIMSLNGSVCSFILIISMRGYKYGSHHGKRAMYLRRITRMHLKKPELSIFIL